MELECEFMKTDERGCHIGGLCMALNTMRPCVIFDTEGKQIKICKSLKVKP